MVINFCDGLYQETSLSLHTSTVSSTYLPFLLQIAYEQVNAGITNLAMEVVGAYVSWIEISLVANDRFVG